MKLSYECKKICLVFLIGILIFSLIGCTGTGNGTNTNNNFPVVVFSDVHFNPFYDPSLFPALVAADARPVGEYFSDIDDNSAFGMGCRYQLPFACACTLQA